MILFVAINYFINSKHDKDVINDIIMKKSEDLSEDDIYEMEQMKAKYLKEKFRVYITRSIIFGVALFFAISYLMPGMDSTKEQILYKGPFTESRKEIPIIQERMIPISHIPQSQFFNEAPW
jgi:hypothetical protein